MRFQRVRDNLIDGNDDRVRLKGAGEVVAGYFLSGHGV